MAARSLAFHVTVDGDEGPVTFGPGDTVPGWAKAKITNPGAWAEGDADEAEPADEDASDWDSSMTKPQLQAVIDARNEGRAEEGRINPEGSNKPDLIKALEADDAASA